MNARKEIIEHIGERKVEFISIAVYKEDRSDSSIVRIKGSLEDVLPLLDFDYDDGYGSQELYGYIWYADGSWSDRGEYDGREWWQHQIRPEYDVEVAI